MSIFVLSACCLVGALVVPWEGWGASPGVVWWVAVRSRNTVRTCGMYRSEWRVWLEIYYGALVIVLRSLDWYRWMTAMLVLVAHPHSSIPYVHTGFSTVLYMRSLFSIDRGECFPMSQYISRVLRSSFLRFIATWSLPRGHCHVVLPG